MKRLNILSIIIAAILVVGAISCSPVRYDEGYDVGYSSSPVYGVDPYVGYYTPSPYYSAPYYGDTYYRGTVRPRREYREGREIRERREERREVRPEVNDDRSYREQNNRVYQNNQPVQHYKGNPLQYLQQQKRNNDRH